MNEWKYTFEPVSKAEWFARIEKELKNRDLEAFQSEWWSGEKKIPFHHKEDLNEPVVLPDEFFLRPPLLMEWIDPSSLSGDSVHQKVLSSLQFGAQSIVFDPGNNVELDFKNWLKGVYANMIEVAVNISGGRVLSFNLEQLKNDVVLRLNRLDGSWDDSFKLINSKSIHPFRFVYRIPSDGNWIEVAINVFKRIMNDLDYWRNNESRAIGFFQNCILVFEPDQSYLKQIIQTRTLQLVWLNISKAKVPEIIIDKSPIEIHIQPNGISDPDKYLLRASTSALAASLTGVKSLCIHHLEREGIPDYYERINRNIHHLLNLESDMYRGIDPLSGSYALDLYTKRWAEQILHELKVY